MCNCRCRYRYELELVHDIGKKMAMTTMMVARHPLFGSNSICLSSSHGFPGAMACSSRCSSTALDRFYFRKLTHASGVSFAKIAKYSKRKSGGRRTEAIWINNDGLGFLVAACPSAAVSFRGCRLTGRGSSGHRIRSYTAESNKSGHIYVMEGDVVRYELPFDPKGSEHAKGVGVVTEIVADNYPSTCRIDPLSKEEESGEWILDEKQQSILIPIGEVEVLQAWYSQRMVPDRVSNPHGEHAESVWLLGEHFSQEINS